MQRSLNPFRRRASVAALTILFASCNGNPARLVELSGEPAAKLAAFEPAEPVLVARADESVVAVVFSEDQAEIAPLLERLLVSEVPGCGRGGWFGREAPVGREGAVACCDPETGTFVLNSKRGWLRMGERCEPSYAEERTAHDDSYDPDVPGVAFVAVEPALSQVLEDLFGIDYPYMQLAETDGMSRALVNGPLPVAELRLPPPIMQRAGRQAGSQMILASHREPPPSGDGCVSSIDDCDRDGSKRCRERWKHWYYKDRFSGDWCEMPSECRC